LLNLSPLIYVYVYLAIYSLSYLLIARGSIRTSREEHNESNRREINESWIFRTLYPDTGESGGTYDIDVLTEPITRTRWTEFKTPSLRVSMRLLDIAESGDTYDPEVEQSFGGELESWSALQTVPRA